MGRPAQVDLGIPKNLVSLQRLKENNVTLPLQQAINTHL